MTKPETKMRRYHYKVYFPEQTSEMCEEFFEQLRSINITYHAAYQMCDDPRNIIELPSKLDLLDPTNKLIEFYENLDEFGKPTGIIQKMLLRICHLNDEFDFTYLVAREGYIVSAWCSDKNDVHRLTKSLYEYYCPNNIKNIVYTRIHKLNTEVKSIA